MKNLKYILVLSTLLSTWGCDDFDDLNESPNNPIQVPVSGLLTNAIHKMPGLDDADVDNDETPTGLLYAQYFSQNQYTTESRYSVSQFDFTTIYAKGLNDLAEVIRLNSNEETMGFAARSGSNANQIAVASILKAYYIIHCTDRWGDLPVSEAFQGTENIAPAYDSQRDIYVSMFQLLKDAVAMMDNGDVVDGDILYGGDMSKWTKFANSLRMRMALRLSNVEESLASSEFNSAYAAGGFESVDDNAVYQYIGDGVYDNRWWSEFQNRTDYVMSATLVDFMLAQNDPRLPAFADQNESGTYAGTPYGLASTTDYPVTSVSLPSSTNVRAVDSPITLFSYSQILFAIAEARQRGWITAGTAQEFYEDAIQASFDEWGAGDASTYLAQAGVAFNAANALQLIGEQKWVALFMDGYEGWAEWRRTGYPALNPAIDAANSSGQIPRRQAYPLSESLNNASNYEAVISSGRQGVDNLDTPVWWDVN
ncbi:SusD/RagB family nutrient-binding outer membrane lipoprotein [Reichenbachiella sp.]|uniref:SusD/RagB family nutrient-binding outer membrane lipoprotein n=1 Tax=Reichenbachiella sp. TaxID=2184521 RepID=UPI003BAE60EC